MIINRKDSIMEKIPERFNESDIIKVKMASISPWSNGLVSFIEKDGVKIGWTEKYEDSETYQTGTPEVFQLICKHNSFLSWYGYFDIDVNPHNFFVKTDKTCDKGGVISLEEMDVTTVCKFFVGMALYYDVKLIERVMGELAPIMLTKDAKLISQRFEAVGESINEYP